jgi:LysM repeat protein
MIIRRFLVISVIAMLVVGLSGCKLPASTPPAATATTAGDFPVPGGEGTDTMGMFERFATQTALAAGGGTPGAPADSASPTETVSPEEAGGGGPTQAPAAPAAPEPTKIVVPTATPGIPANYTLQKGEFPYCIARRFNVNPSELLSANGLTDRSTTYPGLKLKIPQSGRTFPGARALHKHPASYTVRSNDTIYSVACYYGDIDPMAIAQANGLKEPYRLTAGNTIDIP